MIFIDGSNLYYSLRDRCGRADLDYRKFCLALCDGRELRRAYYYNAMRDQSREPERQGGQQRFFDYLRRVPKIEVKLGYLVYRDFPRLPPREKGIDVRLATDMLTHAFRDNYDTAILGAGTPISPMRCRRSRTWGATSRSPCSEAPTHRDGSGTSRTRSSRSHRNTSRPPAFGAGLIPHSG